MTVSAPAQESHDGQKGLGPLTAGQSRAHLLADACSLAVVASEAEDLEAWLVVAQMSVCPQMQPQLELVSWQVVVPALWLQAVVVVQLGVVLPVGEVVQEVVVPQLVQRVRFHLKGCQPEEMMMLHQAVEAVADCPADDPTALSLVTPDLQVAQETGLDAALATSKHSPLHQNFLFGLPTILRQACRQARSYFRFLLGCEPPSAHLLQVMLPPAHTPLRLPLLPHPVHLDLESAYPSH